MTAIWLPTDDDLLDELSRSACVRHRPVCSAWTTTADKHDDQAIAIGIAVSRPARLRHGSAAKDWIESMAPKQEAANDNQRGRLEMEAHPRAGVRTGDGRNLGHAPDTRQTFLTHNPQEAACHTRIKSHPTRCREGTGELKVQVGRVQFGSGITITTKLVKELDNYV